MTEIVVLMIAAGVVSALYIYLYKIIEEKDTLYITLIRYDSKSNTTFTKEIIAFKDHEGNFTVNLEQEYPRYVCCSSINGNKITIETNKNLNCKRNLHCIITKMGLIKVYDK